MNEIECNRSLPNCTSITVLLFRAIRFYLLIFTYLMNTKFIELLVYKLDVEWLNDIVITTGFETCQYIVLIRLGRNHHYYRLPYLSNYKASMVNVSPSSGMKVFDNNSSFSRICFN